MDPIGKDLLLAAFERLRVQEPDYLHEVSLERTTIILADLLRRTREILETPACAVLTLGEYLQVWIYHDRIRRVRCFDNVCERITPPDPVVADLIFKFYWQDIARIQPLVDDVVIGSCGNTKEQRDASIVLMSTEMLREEFPAQDSILPSLSARIFAQYLMVRPVEEVRALRFIDTHEDPKMGLCMCFQHQVNQEDTEHLSPEFRVYQRSHLFA